MQLLHAFFSILPIFKNLALHFLRNLNGYLKSVSSLFHFKNHIFLLCENLNEVLDRSDALNKIWFDDSVQRLNVDERGELLGEFRAEDKLLIITQSGKAKAVKPNLAMHFEDDIIVGSKSEVFEFIKFFNTGLSLAFIY